MAASEDKAMSFAKIVRVKVEQSDDGLIIATSDDLPGFMLAHPDRAVVEEDIPNVIRMIIQHKTHQDVVVAKVEPDDLELDTWVSVPAHVAHSQRQMA